MGSYLVKKSLRPVVIGIEISKIVNVPTRVAVLKLVANAGLDVIWLADEYLVKSRALFLY